MLTINTSQNHCLHECHSESFFIFGPQSGEVILGHFQSQAWGPPPLRRVKLWRFGVTPSRLGRRRKWLQHQGVNDVIGCDWNIHIYIYIYTYKCIYMYIPTYIYIYTVAYACFLLRNMNGSRPLRAPFQGSLFRHWMRWNMMEHTKKRCLPSSGFHVNITRNSDVSLCLNFFEDWIEPSNVSNHRPLPAVNL